MSEETKPDAPFLRPRTEAEKEIILSREARVRRALFIAEGRASFGGDIEEACTDHTEGSSRIFAKRFLRGRTLGSGAGSEGGESFVACFPAKCTKTRTVRDEARGTTREVCLEAACDPERSVPLAVKLVPLKESELPYLVAPLGPGALRTGTFAELAFGVIGSELVRQGVCPNLPLLSQIFTCESCRYTNRIILRRDFAQAYPERFARLKELGYANRPQGRPEGEPLEPDPKRTKKRDPVGVPDPKVSMLDLMDRQRSKLEKFEEGEERPLPAYSFLDAMGDSEAGAVDAKIPCLVILNELATGTALDWAARQEMKGRRRVWVWNDRSEDEWVSFIFQWLVALAAMDKYAGMVHSDVFMENILYHSIDTDAGRRAIYRYRLDGVDYFVPLHGSLFILWDFGYATSDKVPNSTTSRSRLRHILDKRYILGKEDREYYTGGAFDVGWLASTFLGSFEEPYQTLGYYMQTPRMKNIRWMLQYIHKTALLDGADARQIIPTLFTSREWLKRHHDIRGLRPDQDPEDVMGSFDMDAKLKDVPLLLSHLFTPWLVERPSVDHESPDEEHPVPHASDTPVTHSEESGASGSPAATGPSEPEPQTEGGGVEGSGRAPERSTRPNSPRPKKPTPKTRPSPFQLPPKSPVPTQQSEPPPISIVFEHLMRSARRTGFTLHPAFLVMGEALEKGESLDLSRDQAKKSFLVQVAFGDQTSLAMDPSYQTAFMSYLRVRYPRMTVIEDTDPPVLLRGKALYLKKTDASGQVSNYAITLSGLLRF